MRRISTKLLIALCISLFLLCNPLILSHAAENKKSKDNETETESRVPDLKPGKWEPLYRMGKNLFPSVVISTVTLKEDEDDERDPNHLGAIWGTIGIAICAPKNDCPVSVEISSGTFIKPTMFNVTLPKKGTTYFLFSDLKYEYEKLLKVTQTVPEDITFKVIIDGKNDPERTDHLQVRSINECVYYFVDYDGNSVDTPWFFAAYANENHPYINGVLADALNSGKVSSFSGPSGDEKSQLDEINAIWDALKRRGIHYSSITTTSDDDNPDLSSQHVRLLGQSINYSQANCVDGSVLLASILRKIGFDVNLVTTEDHMYVAIASGEDGDSLMCIETTMLGDSSLEEAIEDGNKEFDEDEDKFFSDDDKYSDYNIISIMDARSMGIMPIKDSISN